MNRIFNSYLFVCCVNWVFVCLLTNSTFRLSENEPDIECYVAEMPCHESLKTSRKDNHVPWLEAAFGDVVLTRKNSSNCDDSVAYTITMCLLSSYINQPVVASVSCYDYDFFNADEYLAFGTTSATDGCIALSYVPSR